MKIQDFSKLNKKEQNLIVKLVKQDRKIQAEWLKKNPIKYNLDKLFKFGPNDKSNPFIPRNKDGTPKDMPNLDIRDIVSVQPMDSKNSIISHITKRRKK